MTHFLLRSTVLSLLMLSLSVPTLAAPLKIDNTKSKVNIVFKQMNVPVEAQFKVFSAQIDFDVARPDAAKASIDISIPSFDLGDPDYNKEVLKKEWFNAPQFPKASFIANSIKANTTGKDATGSNKYHVSGTLTIKGKPSPVDFPLTVKKDGVNTIFDGTLPIKRLTYNIGEGEWKDTSMVADEVTIKFHFVTH